MAKFIIEISDEYIRQHGNINNMNSISFLDPGFIQSALEFIACHNISKAIDKGTSEFHVTPETVRPDRQGLFGSIITYLGVMINDEEDKKK